VKETLDEIAAGFGEPLSRACRRFPPHRQAKPVTLSCLVRWITRGVRAPNGGRIRLEAARLAGRWITTPGAIARFLAAQTPSLDGDPLPTPRAPAARQQASERAAAELERLGI
jgi:hypothetical protein